MTIVLFATMSPTLAEQFNHIVDLAVILIIVPYVYSAVAVVKVVHDHDLPRTTFLTYKWIALAAVAYCLWAVIGGDPDTVVHAMVALLISVPLYPFFIRSMEAAAKRKQAQPRRLAPLTPPPIPRCERQRNEGLRHDQKELRHAVALSLRQRRRASCLQSLAAAIVLALAAASAFGAEEEAPATPPPGLPAGFDWTFNFDATWGAFGFAQLPLHEPEARRSPPAISATTGSRARSSRR